MKKALLAALILVSSVPAIADDQDRAETNCRQWVAGGIYKEMGTCVAETLRAYGILDQKAASMGSAPGGDYSPALPAPTIDSPQPLPNIIPPTTRCQSVAVGSRTVQTICR